MLEDFADLCTYLYVLTDEAYREVVAPYDRRPGPDATCSDSALITLTLAAELVGIAAETRFLAYVRRNYRALFPLLPERSRYNRRRRQLVEATNRLRNAIMARLWRVLEAEGRDLCVVDSLPVPVVGYHHAAGDHRWWGEADFGRVPSKQQRLYGFKLHLLISHSGLILDFTLAAANHHDGALTAQLLEGKAGLTVLGDKGYINGPLPDALAARHDLTLLTPKRKNQLAQLPEALTQAIHHFRQIIETVNSQVVEQFQLQRNRCNGYPVHPRVNWATCWDSRRDNSTVQSTDGPIAMPSLVTLALPFCLGDVHACPRSYSPAPICSALCRHSAGAGQPVGEASPALARHGPGDRVLGGFACATSRMDKEPGQASRCGVRADQRRATRSLARGRSGWPGARHPAASAAR